VADLWNQANPQNRDLHGMSECPNPKHIISNSNYQEMVNLGFADIVLVSQVQARFSGSAETCMTYHYARRSLLDQGKHNQKYSHENPVPLDEVCPIFQSAWKDYLDGRSHMEQAQTSDPDVILFNRVIQDRLLSDGYYQETLPKVSDRKRNSSRHDLEDCE
jgi:hypothetical protein